jgi:hypothetical protein
MNVKMELFRGGNKQGLSGKERVKEGEYNKNICMFENSIMKPI